MEMWIWLLFLCLVFLVALMARSKPKKKSEKQKMKILKEVFGTPDTHCCWALSGEKYVGGEVVNQNPKVTCAAHATVACIAATSACLSGGQTTLNGSIQELSERLHYIFPLLKNIRGYDLRFGIPNSVENCFKYVVHWGLYPEWKYPSRATVNDVVETEALPPGKKITSDSYEFIESDIVAYLSPAGQLTCVKPVLWRINGER